MTPYFEADGVTLYHGDCRAMLGEMQDSSVDFVFIDPPYGHNNNNGDLIQAIHSMQGSLYRMSNPNDARPIDNDGEEANELLDSVLPEFNRVLSPGNIMCCCCGGGGGPDPQFARWSMMIDAVMEFKMMVVWDKGPIGMGWHYRRSYETILVAMKKGAACSWFDDSMRIENIIRPGDYGIMKIIPSSEQHPTEKPPELAMHFIKLHTQPGAVVLDTFAGSGSTAIAALRLGRRVILAESDERWCEYAARRIEAELRQPRLFIADAQPEPQAEQGSLFDMTREER